MDTSNLTPGEKAAFWKGYRRGWYAGKRRYSDSAHCKWCGKRTDGQVYHELCLQKKQTMVKSKSL